MPACSAMAAICGALRDAGFPASTDFQGDRHRYRIDHCLENTANQQLVRQQGRADSLPANSFGGAAHVDVNNMGAMVSAVLRSSCHLFGICA
jgi:hypothetical protein